MNKKIKILHLQLNNSGETILAYSSGRTVLLHEFVVPSDYKAIDFKLDVQIKDGNDAPMKSYIVILTQTKDKHIADLANNLSEQVPKPKHMSIVVTKPFAAQATDIPMFICYELL